MGLPDDSSSRQIDDMVFKGVGKREKGHCKAGWWWTRTHPV